MMTCHLRIPFYANSRHPPPCTSVTKHRYTSLARRPGLFCYADKVIPNNKIPFNPDWLLNGAPKLGSLLLMICFFVCNRKLLHLRDRLRFGLSSQSKHRLSGPEAGEPLAGPGRSLEDHGLWFRQETNGQVINSIQFPSMNFVRFLEGNAFTASLQSPTE